MPIYVLNTERITMYLFYFILQSVTEVNNTCIMCLEHFIRMNQIYKGFVKNIITEDGSGICMDIVDQVS